MAATDGSNQTEERGRVGPKGVGRAQGWNSEAVWQQLQAAAKEDARVRYGRFAEAAVAWDEERSEVDSLGEAGDTTIREEEAWWEENCLGDEQCWSLLREAGGEMVGEACQAEHAAEWRTAEGKSGGGRNSGKQSEALRGEVAGRR